MSAMEQILRLMATQKASDVYLSAHSPALMRLHGQCVPINQQPLPPDAPLRLLAEIVPPERLQELEASGELNMGLALEGAGRFRLSAMRQRGSCAAVIRFIAQEIPPLESLQLPKSLQKLVMRKRGLILVTGATGSGKSTTLASMIDARNAQESGHILTIEDPIEYQFSNRRCIVNQREVGSDTESLHIALKNALRQAPDVILIGEIRDRETMTAAMAFAQSGHLCLSTLHANNSYHALQRVLSFYEQEVHATVLGELSVALLAIISQRLIPATDGGRLPAAEVMFNTKLIGELIARADFVAIKDAMEKSLADNSQTFEQSLAQLIRSGKISRADGLAHADSASNLAWQLENQANPLQAAAKADAAQNSLASEAGGSIFGDQGGKKPPPSFDGIALGQT